MCSVGTDVWYFFMFRSGGSKDMYPIVSISTCVPLVESDDGAHIWWGRMGGGVLGGGVFGVSDPRDVRLCQVGVSVCGEYVYMSP